MMARCLYGNAAQDQWKAFIDAAAGVNVMSGISAITLGTTRMVSPWVLPTIAFTSANGDKWGVIPRLYLTCTCQWVKRHPQHRQLQMICIPRLTDSQTIDTMAKTDPQSPDSMKLGQDFIKMMTENMYTAINAVSFK